MLLSSSMPRHENLLALIKSRRQRLAIAAALFLLILLYLVRASVPEDFLSSLHAATPSPSSTRTAVIIETRPLSNLISLLLHFSAVLGPTWNIALYTTTATAAHLNSSAPFAAHLASGRIQLVLIPSTETFSDRASVSGFFTRPWFWQSLAPAHHALLFQADSIICANAPQRVEDFLAYDFVGAPINRNLGVGNGYNGGLSLRNVDLMLEVVQTHDWEAERLGNSSFAHVEFEDQWFFQKLSERGDARLPDEEVASRFSVESVWAEEPLGYHQVARWQPERMPEVMRWCPEYSIATQEMLSG